MCVGWGFFGSLFLRGSRCKVQILISSLICAWQRGFRLLAWFIALLYEALLWLLFLGERGRVTLRAFLAGWSCCPATAQYLAPSVIPSERGTLRTAIHGGGTLNPVNAAS